MANWAPGCGAPSNLVMCVGNVGLVPERPVLVDSGGSVYTVHRVYGVVRCERLAFLGSGSSFESGFNAKRRVTSIAFGASHCIVLTDLGGAFGCGNNALGQLGNAHKASALLTAIVKPSDVAEGVTVARIAAGGNNTLLLLSDGSLWGCGENSCGELVDRAGALRALEHVTLNSALKRGENVTCFDISRKLAVAVTSNNRILVSGESTVTRRASCFEQWLSCSNDLALSGSLSLSGQSLDRSSHSEELADSRSSASEAAREDAPPLNPFCVPVDFVAEGDAIEDVVCCESLILRTRGGCVFGCGTNSFGELGLRHYDVVPDITHLDATWSTQFGGMCGAVAKVQASHSGTVMQSTSGSLFACGANIKNRLGIGATEVSSEMLPVDEHRTVRQIACSQLATVLVLDTGEATVLGESVLCSDVEHLEDDAQFGPRMCKFAKSHHWTVDSHHRFNGTVRNAVCTLLALQKCGESILHLCPAEVVRVILAHLTE